MPILVANEVCKPRHLQSPLITPGLPPPGSKETLICSVMT